MLRRPIETTPVIGKVPRSTPGQSWRLHFARRFSPTLALLYDREKQKGNANRATLAVARKLVRIWQQ